MESLEPLSQSQHTQGEATLEVIRIVRIQEMQIDVTKPLAEQSIMVNEYGPCEIKILLRSSML